MNEYIHSLQIGGLTLSSNLFLGPMAGFTDQAFRKLCRRCSGDSLGLVCTEMVSAKAIVFNNRKTADLMKNDDDERPIAVQLFGNDPAVISEAAARIDEDSYDILFLCFTHQACYHKWGIPHLDEGR